MVQVIFSEEPSRYTHFSYDLSHCSNPNPLRIITVYDFEKQPNILKNAKKASVPFLVDSNTFVKAIPILNTYYEMLHSVILSVSIEMFVAVTRTSEFYVLRQFCKKVCVLFGAYIHQSDEYIYVPIPHFNHTISNAFDYHILDTAVTNKYESIKYMANYLLQQGIVSRRIVPLYVPFANYNIRNNNMMGYFFRKDLYKVNETSYDNLGLYL